MWMWFVTIVTMLLAMRQFRVFGRISVLYYSFRATLEVPLGWIEGGATRFFMFVVPPFALAILALFISPHWLMYLLVPSLCFSAYAYGARQAVNMQVMSYTQQYTDEGMQYADALLKAQHTAQRLVEINSRR